MSASPPTAPRRLRPGPLLAAAVLLCGCTSTPNEPRLFGLIAPYRIEVVQGNVVTREQAAQLRPGMTRQQVIDVLGSPLLASVFHADRWDYVFTIRRQGAEPQRRSIVVWFDGDRLQRTDVPELPSEIEFVETISNVRPRAVPKLELDAAERAALPAPARTAAAAPPGEPLGPARDYPPLER